MPYSIKTDHPDCSSGYAVVKTETGEVVSGGCHETESAAADQITAINISESERAPAPKGDQIFGSGENKPGSASGKVGDIELSPETETALQNKADTHNETMKEEDRPEWTRVRVGSLRSVYRRGAGAFSVSHRPGMTRGQWAMGRVNAFLFLARRGRPEDADYVGDNDLLHPDHPRYAPKEDSRAGYTPTAGMKAEAERGLEWRREFGRGGTLVGVARARDIINGRELPLETVMRMYSYFARHEVDKQGQGFSPDQDGYPSAGRIAWALWGGDPGRTWANAIVEAAKDDDDERSFIEEIEREMEIERRARMDYGTRKVGCRVEVHALRRLADYEALRNEAPQANWQDADLLPIGHPRRVEETEHMARAKEIRTAPMAEFEVRETESGGLTFSGYAALFDTPSQPLPFIETIAPGAFARTLGRAAKGQSVVKLLHGHNNDEMLAATPTSLELSEDERGLRVKAEIVDSPLGQHVAALVRRDPQAVSMSFGFRVPKGGERWDGNTRTVTQADLAEVSILTGHSPAYAETAGLSSVRSYSSLAEKLGVDAEVLAAAFGAAAMGNELSAEDADLLAAAAKALRVDAVAEALDDAAEALEGAVEAVEEAAEAVAEARPTEEAPSGEVPEMAAPAEESEPEADRSPVARALLAEITRRRAI